MYILLIHTKRGDKVRSCEIVYFLPDAARIADVAEFVAAHTLSIKETCVCSVEFEDGDLAAEFVSILEDKSVAFDRVHRYGRDVEVVECVRRLESGMVHRFRSSFVVGAYRPVIVRAVFAETKGGCCGVF